MNLPHSTRRFAVLASPGLTLVMLGDSGAALITGTASYRERVGWVS